MLVLAVTVLCTSVSNRCGIPPALSEYFLASKLKKSTLIFFQICLTCVYLGYTNLVLVYWIEQHEFNRYNKTSVINRFLMNIYKLYCNCKLYRTLQKVSPTVDILGTCYKTIFKRTVLKLFLNSSLQCGKSFSTLFHIRITLNVFVVKSKFIFFAATFPYIANSIEVY